MQKNINVILSLVNMSEKKQHYKPIRNLTEINTLFKNKPIVFNIANKKYALIYNPANYELQVKAQYPTPAIIATFNQTSSLEQILHTFGKL
ncbi:hypothetical protein G6N05_14270 [Flavobacterium sp. F372]|uniref:Uncharacterized protein n=1 Tax=Flavobacterium bernardetii TaxID=2813823 RepID=A0ABR7J285_9FLAO|nr:hypothetical protein [Flavobacterium bernardetii]MBC5836092.1 hypothetical protein [Flavobacterium bernardetii]NHF71277.1 hypothetical protein [Flavobacterium bernardetii]